MFEIIDGEAYFRGESLGKIEYSMTKISSPVQPQIVLESVEPETGHLRQSYYDTIDCRFKVRRVPIVHG